MYLLIAGLHTHMPLPSRCFRTRTFAREFCAGDETSATTAHFLAAFCGPRRYDLEARARSTPASRSSQPNLSSPTARGVCPTGPANCSRSIEAQSRAERAAARDETHKVRGCDCRADPAARESFVQEAAGRRRAEATRDDERVRLAKPAHAHLRLAMHSKCLAQPIISCWAFGVGDRAGLNVAGDKVGEGAADIDRNNIGHVTSNPFFDYGLVRRLSIANFYAGILDDIGPLRDFRL